MTDIFSVNTIAFTILDYPMSYIELVGTILYLWSVWLIARRNILTWPIGIVSVGLYMVLFYQIRLYSDMLEQVYYLGASAYGWWHWRKVLQNQPADQNKVQDVFYSSSRVMIIAVVVTAILTIISTFVISQIHLWLPDLFPDPASYPFLDALTTVMSFTAMWLMAQKRIESWYYWIIVDVIGIWLYYVKEVKFIAALYVVLLIIVINAFISWHKARKPSPSDLQQA